MEGHFDHFEEILGQINNMSKNKFANVNDQVLSNLETYLNEIFKGLKTCGKKMTSAAKFIDFFVHDILDYTMLNKEEKGFTKALMVFDIREAVLEIITIQEDKAKFKNISLRTVYNGFENDEEDINYFVKSDQKRL